MLLENYRPTRRLVPKQTTTGKPKYAMIDAHNPWEINLEEVGSQPSGDGAMDDLPG